MSLTWVNGLLTWSHTDESAGRIGAYGGLPASGMEAPGGVTSFTAAAVTDAVVERVAYPPIQALAGQHIAWQRAISRAFELYGHRKLYSGDAGGTQPDQGKSDKPRGQKNDH